MEKFLLVHVPSLWLAIGMVVVAVGTTLLGFVIVRRITGHTQLASQHDVAGFLIAVVGVIYAVALAFVVVVQWEQYAASGENANAEAAAVGGVYRDAAALGQNGAGLRAAVTRYAREVVLEEWPYMAAHQEEDPTTDVARNEMWNQLLKIRVHNPVAQDFLNQAVADVTAASNDRRTRIHDSRGELPTPLWIVLLVGGVLTICFCYFFSLESFVAQAAMMSILSTLIALMLFVIMSLDLPYTGSVSIKPEAMIDEINEFCGYNFTHPHIRAMCTTPIR